MFVLSCVIILTILSAGVSDASSNRNQFYCGLPDKERCVDKANNLTGCRCPEQGDRYCPFNNSCLPSGSYNENACWENASCSIGSMTSTIAESYAPTAATIANIFATAGGNTINVSQSISVLPSSSVNYVPIITTKPTTFYSLNTDYTPIIITVAAGFGSFVVFVCCMCAIHSWWLKRNKFTGVNSTPLSDVEKRRRKQERREAKQREREQEEEKEPSKFDMGYRMPQKVNERALANYDWARTSYLPGMLEPTVHDPNHAESIPKLICDDDDSDLDDPNELGDDNVAYEYVNDDPRKVASPSISSLFTPVEEMEPQEPVVVEPEIFESMEEIPRPPPDGDMGDSEPPPPSQDYFQMMGRF